jgi:hypothetical protein
VRRFESLAERLGFSRFQIWLISNEGFSEEASKVLDRRKAFGSSRQQLELLARVCAKPYRALL